MTHKHTNRLAREKSPYLLQHAHNPVDWYAWGEEAFAKARAENKLILLSIGYSTCHWCHVMERESFEDEKVGALLGEHFVSIKVDREERPDVDKIYMTFVQATTGSGGWPLNVFLTPDLKPFFGGTYFPPDARYGRPSFTQLLQQVAGFWRERHSEVLASADELHTRLELAAERSADDVPLTAEAIQRAAQMFKEAYDPRQGGFGGAPKFPQPGMPLLLLRYAKRFGDAEATRMVLHTCERMAAGGIHDQLGGGFARYAVDAEWLVPHFEKMLYDNAQLAQLYLDTHLLSEGGAPRSPELKMGGGSVGVAELHPPEESDFGAVARDILDYVLRDMTHPEGGFYSAEDADSEGQEGKFYCWTHEELSKLLSPEEFNVVARYFGITKAGNFVDHSHPSPLPGLNVLSVVEPIGRDGMLPSHISPPEVSKAEIGDGNMPSLPDDQTLLASARAKMLKVRATRVRPGLDDKVLASWNGLMLGAMARAGVVLGEERYRMAAERNVKFVRAKLWVDGGNSNSDGSFPLTPALSPGEREKRSQRLEEATPTGGSVADGKIQVAETSNIEHPTPNSQGVGALFHRWRDGERDSVQLLEGYAFMLDGVVQLYEATLTPEHLDFAVALAEAMVAKFYDPANGGFWQSTGAGKDLILRVKDDYDGAEPSGNSVAVLALLKLAAITDREDFRQPAEATLRLFAAKLQQQPHGLAAMLQALDFWLEPPRRVVIVGTADSADFKKLLAAAHSVYQPNKVVLGNVGAVEPFAKTLPAKDEATVYLCAGTACQPPTSEAAKVRELMG